MIIRDVFEVAEVIEQSVSVHVRVPDWQDALTDRPSTCRSEQRLGEGASAHLQDLVRSRCAFHGTLDHDTRGQDLL